MKQRYQQLSDISRTSASTSLPIDRRGASPMDPFTPQQRYEMVTRFLGGSDIPRLAKEYAVGYKLIQTALRAQLRAELARIW
jgi:hypothetical protein